MLADAHVAHGVLNAAHKHYGVYEAKEHIW
jgi:hypothetical protein